MDGKKICMMLLSVSILQVLIRIGNGAEVRVTAPVKKSCQLSVAVAQVELVSSSLEESLLLQEEVISRIKQWCVEVRGRGEDYFYCGLGSKIRMDLLPDSSWTLVGVRGETYSGDAWSAAIVPGIEFQTADAETLLCRRGEEYRESPFPLSDTVRQAMTQSLILNWPRPQSHVFAVPTLAASLTLAHENHTISTLTGSLCLHIYPLQQHRTAKISCIQMNDAEFVEFTIEKQHSQVVAIVFKYYPFHDQAALSTVPIEVWIHQELPVPITRPWSSASPLLLVLCHWRENVEWLHYQSYPYLIYEKRPDLRGIAAHYTPRNTANEASAYLQFIIDYYHTLPEHVAFLHSHRYAYHQEDILTLLNDLTFESEYCNINSAVWGTNEDPQRSFLYNSKHRQWLESYLGPLPPLLLDRCCAQFIVHRNRILARPLAFYQGALRIALDPLVSEDSTEDNRQLGLFFEWLWHFIFGEPPIASAELERLVPNITQTELIYFHHSRPSCLLSR